MDTTTHSKVSFFVHHIFMVMVMASDRSIVEQLSWLRCLQMGDDSALQYSSQLFGCPGIAGEVIRAD